MNEQESPAAKFWRSWFSPEGYDFAKEQRMFRLFKMLPSSPRCEFCSSPFNGIGATLVRMAFGKKPSQYNTRFCNLCDEIARKHPGGAEVQMSILFADLRGSTPLSESMSATEFSQLINRFYVEATQVLVESNAIVDKLSGDEVAAFWGAGFAGKDYVLRTIRAGQDILKVTGHGGQGDPWAPVGVGVHTGIAFFGSMGQVDGMHDLTAVGEEVNMAARLAANAGPGEILVSRAAMEAANLPPEDYDDRRLQLKGLTQPVTVSVLRVD